ncbi:hypothetical protein MVES_001893 [Malassezia vespertilionis]|uniref:TFIIH C1-like domain-containing protein n=1 Tax=Malassezia vespertilionis TaxID=2020962 RepID=A0A2N1JB80_9BASI|nr:hypothetical protein MVES_001893 [Malassezia vespertilionis]
MSRREEYVDGAEFDDSDELVEGHSEDSDEYEALPVLPSAPLRSALAEKTRRAPQDDRKLQRKEPEKRAGVQNGYSWEAAYQRSWDHVHEDESGNLENAVRHMLDSNKRKRYRGIIRHFVLILDLSEDMMDRDFRNTVDHGALLANKRKLEPHGEPSVQNALEMARSSLAHLPNTNTREILYISASLTTVDPGNIYHTIDHLVEDHVQVSVISLAAEMHIMKELCKRTGGDYNVAIDEEHYKQLFESHVAPRIITEREAVQEDGADLLVMGFPMRLPFNAPLSLCACHGRVLHSTKKSAQLENSGAVMGYTCPRCYSKVCQVPTDCPTCGITIIMSTHLARSYHHLFPVGNYTPLPWAATGQDATPSCFACAMPFPEKPSADVLAQEVPMMEAAALAPSARYQCARCLHHFCLECDAFEEFAASAAGDHQARPESDIIQAYSVSASDMPLRPSYESSEDPNPPSASFRVEEPVSVQSEQYGYVDDLDEGFQHPVSTADDPLTKPSPTAQARRRVRWGAPQESEFTRIHVRPHGAGSTISIRRPAGRESSGTHDEATEVTDISSPQRSTGIKRSNHPGQISLDGLGPVPQAEEVPMQNLAPGTSGFTGALDLAGEDNDRYLALSHELNLLHDVSDDEADISAQIRDSIPQELHNANTEQQRLMGLISGETTPGSRSESSYDPAEDLEQVDLIEGEVDGMPAKPKKSERKKRPDDLDPLSRGWSLLRKKIGLDRQASDTHDDVEKANGDEGPTNQKSVPVRTSTGIRGVRNRPKPSKLEREAARLVRTHRLMSKQAPSETEEPVEEIKHDHLPDSGASTPDTLETAMNMDSRPVNSGGVLGNLLKLYEQQRAEETVDGQREKTMVDDSVSTSYAGVTNLDGGLSLVGNTIIDSYGNEAKVQDLDPRLLEQVIQPPTERPPIASPSQLYSSGRATQPRAPINLMQMGDVGQKMIHGMGKEVGIDVMDERPKAARSSAGTIGALMATTGNLIGAVSPAHAQIGPNPKRPGYTLNRYLLPEMNAKTLRRTAKIVRDAAPVPKSIRDHQYPMVDTPGRDESYFSQNNAKSIANSSMATSHKQYGSGAISKFARGLRSGASSAGSDSAPGNSNDYFGNAATAQAAAKAEWQKKLKKRKKRNKKQEIFITMHVAAILARQEFLMKFARAMMMFGAPTHRLEIQMQQTANVLEVNCRCIYFPNLMILSFGDENTHTSDTKIIKQGSVLDLTKLTDMHTIYWNVIHDKIGVDRASKQLDALMRRKPYLRRWHHTIVGGFASAFICLGEVGFGGTFLDACAAFVLGAFLIFCQMSLTSELYSNVFEIVFATVNSFIALALHAIHSGDYFCYRSVVSGSIVLILPGFIVLSGALELQSKNIVSGSVRLVYAVIYSVLLGIGIKIGAAPLSGIKPMDGRDPFSCSRLAPHSPWYTKVPSKWFAFLTVPCYSICLSIRNQGKITRKEFPVMVLVACAGWVVANFPQYSNDSAASLKQQTALVAAMGSFAVGVLSNIYGRIFDGRSFVVAVPGILYQLPSGLSGNGTTLVSGVQQSSVSANTTTNSTVLQCFAPNGLPIDIPSMNNTMGTCTAKNQTTANSSGQEVQDGLEIGTQLLNVSLGITIGLFCSTILMHLLGGRKVRGSGLFSF